MLIQRHRELALLLLLIMAAAGGGGMLPGEMRSRALAWLNRLRLRIFPSFSSSPSSTPPPPPPPPPKLSPIFPRLVNSISGGKEDFIPAIFTACKEAELTSPHGLGVINSLGARKQREILLVTNPAHATLVLQASTQHMRGGTLIEATHRFLGPKCLFALEQPEEWRYERLKTKSVLVMAMRSNRRTRAVEDTVLRMVQHMKRELKPVFVPSPSSSSSSSSFSPAATHTANKQMDVHALFLRLHLAVVGKLILGNDLGFFPKPPVEGGGDAAAVPPPQGEEIIQAFEYLVQQMPRIPAHPEIMDTAEWSAKSEDARRACRKVVQASFAQRKTSGARPSSVLHDVFALLTDADGNEDKEQAVVDEVTDCVLQFFLAGFNTVAVEMSFCLFYLCQNPAWWPVVRAEVDGAIAAAASPNGGPALLPLALDKLPVLNAVRMETLRLVPPSAFTTRTLHDALVLAPDVPAAVPAGTQVLIPIVYLHASSKAWGADAGSFSPKRWLETEEDKKPGNGGFLGFGAGPRNCVGEALSTQESLTALAWLVRDFSFQLVGGSSMQIPKWTGYGIRPFDSASGTIAMHLQVSRRTAPIHTGGGGGGRARGYTMQRLPTPVASATPPLPPPSPSSSQALSS